MKQIYLFFTIGILIMTVSFSHAYSFFDDFNRTGLGSWNYIEESSGGSQGVSGNRLYVDNGSSESIGDNFVYYNTGQTLTDVTLSGILNMYDPTSSITAFYMGINATPSELTKYSGAGAGAYTKGYGVFAPYPNRNTEMYIVDRSTNKDFWNSSDDDLAEGSFQFAQSTDYNFELIYGADMSLEARFWKTNQSRPTSAAISYSPGAAPQYSGTNLFFGITDEGRLQIDNVSLTSNASASLSVNNNVNFGNVRVGTSSTASVTVQNSGDSGTNLTGNIGAASGSEFSPTSGTQDFTLAQNETSSRTFTYTPDSQGNDASNVTVNTNEDGSANVILSGTGVSPVFNSSVAPGSTIDFGMIHLNTSVAEHPDIPPTKYKTITISNITTDTVLGNLTDLSILNAYIEGDSTFDIIDFTPVVISKNGSIDITIRYSTIMAHNGGVSPDQGIKNATLTLVTDLNAAFGEAGETLTFDLTGQVVPEPSSIILLGMFLITFAILRKKK